MIDLSQVTIIIPHLGTTPESEYALDQCWASLVDTAMNIKKIIVKNGPPCRHEGNIRINDQGQCKAVNAAAATVNTPWIFVTNDDMVYAPGWFEKLIEGIEGMEGLEKIRCISPKLIEPKAGAPTFGVYFCGGAGGDFDKTRWLEFAEDWPTFPEQTQHRTGFNLPFLISKELWDIIGGYDVNYDPWGSNSDSDLEYKIKLAGVQPYQNEKCIVYHFSQTSDTFHPDNQSYWQKNWDYFIKKWGFPRTDDGIWEANFKIPTVGEGRVFTPDWEGHYGTGSF